MLEMLFLGIHRERESRRGRLGCLLGFVILCMAVMRSHPAGAADVTADWTDFGGGLWSDASKWSSAPLVPDNVPGTTFAARVLVPHDGIDLDLDVELESLLYVSQDAIGGAGSLTLTDSFNWFGGELAFGGALETRGETLVFGSSQTLRGTDVVNSGVFTIQDSGSGVTLTGIGSTFQNELGGVIQLDGASSLLDLSDAGSQLENRGTIRRTAAAGSGEIRVGRFANEGTIESLGGTLVLTGPFENRGLIRGTAGSTVSLAGGVNELAVGVIDTEGDLLLSDMSIAGSTRVAGRATVLGDTTFSGPRSSLEIADLSVESGTARFLGEGLTIDSLSVQGTGALVVDGALEVTSNLSWTGGTIDSFGAIRNSGQGLLATQLMGTLVNTGELELGAAILSSNSALQNLPGGVLRTGDGSDVIASTPILNEGRHEHSGAGETTGRIRGIYDNQGTLDVLSGALSLNGLTGQGRVHVASGATLRLSNSLGAPVPQATIFEGAGNLLLFGISAPIETGWDVTGSTSLESSTIEFVGPVTSVGTLRLQDGRATFSETDSETDLILEGLEMTRRSGASTNNQLELGGATRVRGPVIWTHGSIGGTGTLFMEEGFHIEGSGHVSLSVDVVNQGDSVYDGRILYIDEGGRLVNDTTGRIVYEGGFSIGGTNLHAQGVVENRGTWIHRDEEATVELPFSNSGDLIVESGSLRLRDGGTFTGRTEVREGAELSFELRDWEFDPGASFEGLGTLVLAEDGGVVPLGAGFQFGGTTILSGVAAAVDGAHFGGAGLAIEAGTLFTRGAATATDVENAGSIRFDPDGRLTIEGAYSGHGWLVFRGGTLASSSDLTLAGTRLVGTGRIESDLQLTSRAIPEGAIDAVVAPGQDRFPSITRIGLLEVVGDVDLDAVEIDIELEGLTRGVEYDAIDVDGIVDLGGLLSVSVLGDFTTRIDESDEFEILSSTSPFVGAIQNASDGERLFLADEVSSFLVSYRGDSSGGMSLVLSDYRVIPEPGTALLVAFGLTVMSARRRSRATAERGTEGRRRVGPNRMRKGGRLRNRCAHQARFVASSSIESQTIANRRAAEAKRWRLQATRASARGRP